MMIRAMPIVLILALVISVDADSLDLLPSAILWCAQSGRSYIRCVNDIPANWFTSTTRFASLPTSDSKNFFVHIDVGYMKKNVAWMQGSSTIASQSVDGLLNELNARDKGIFYLDPSTTLSDIASDVYTGSVYFVDSKNRFIGITASSSENGTSSYFKVIVRQNIYQPTSLVLDPDEGFMFWLDLSSNGNLPLLQKATLVGTQQQVISKSLTLLRTPRDLAIDMTEQRLYWLAIVGAQTIVAHCDYNGQNEGKVVISLPSAQPYSFSPLALYEDYIITAANDLSRITVFNKTGMFIGSFATDAAVNDIKTVGNAVNNTHECLTLGCTEFCLNLGHMQGVCSCIEGHQLMYDKKTCEAVKEASVIISTGRNIFKSDLTIYPKNNSLDISTTLLPVHVANATALSFNFAQNLLYIVDSLARNIVVSSTTSSSVNELTVNTNATGIAVDYGTGNVYWTNRDKKAITVVTEDGRYPYTTTQPSSPRKITVDANGPLYWTDGMSVYKTNLAAGRPTTISSGEKGIEGIVADPSTQKLAWAVNDPWIDTMTYNGTGARSYSTASMSNLQAVTLFGDTIIWGQSDSNKLQFIRIEDNSTFRWVNEYPSADFITPNCIMDLILYASYLQPNVSTPCTVANGGCAQLCLTTSPQERSCACGLGFTLSPDGVSCQSESVDSHFLLMVDPYHKQIYQLSTNENSHVEGVPMSRTTQPISVDYDLTKRRVYWIETGQGQGHSSSIYSSTLTGSDQKVFFDGSLTVSSPWRLAVDGGNGLVFFVDVSQGSVVSVSINDSSVRTLVSHVTNPRAIALDMQTRTVYFTDDNSLQACSYAGSNLRQVTSSFIEPIALAVGPKGDILVGDKSKRVLASVNVTSGATVDMVTAGVWQVAAVTVDSQHIYFTAWDKGAVYRVPLVNAIASQPQMLEEVFARITDIRYVDGLTAAADTKGPVGVNLALILGITLSLLFLLLLCFLLICFCYRRRHRCATCKKYHKQGHCQLDRVGGDFVEQDKGKVNPVNASGVPDKLTTLEFESEDKEGMSEYSRKPLPPLPPGQAPVQDDVVDEGIGDDKASSGSDLSDEATAPRDLDVVVRPPPPPPKKKNIMHPTLVQLQASLKEGGAPVYPRTAVNKPKESGVRHAKPACHHTPTPFKSTLPRHGNKLRQYGSHEELPTIHTATATPVHFDTAIAGTGTGQQQQQQRLSRHLSIEQLDTLDMVTAELVTTDQQEVDVEWDGSEGGASSSMEDIAANTAGDSELF